MMSWTVKLRIKIEKGLTAFRYLTRNTVTQKPDDVKTLWKAKFNVNSEFHWPAYLTH